MTHPHYAVSVHWLSHVAELTAENLPTAHAACLERAADAGAGGVEIPIAHAAPFLDRFVLHRWRQMSRTTRDMGLKIVSAHGPTFPKYDHCAPEEAASPIINLVHACSEAEIPVLVVHPTYHPALHVTTHALASLEYDVRVANRIGQAISGTGVKLAIENVPHNSWRYLSELFSRIDEPAVGMCFDTGHYQVRPELPLDNLMRQFGQHIVHVHLSDNNGFSDQHLAPGGGVFPYENWLPMLDPSLLDDMLIEVSVPTLVSEPNAPEMEREILRGAVRQTSQTLDPIVSVIRGRPCDSR